MDPNYPQNSPAYPPSAALPTSTLAIVSLISGILGFTFIPVVGSIIAIITGMMARGETRGSSVTASGDGLATAGIVMGWVGVGLTVVGVLCFACTFIFPFLLAIPAMFLSGG